MHRTELRPLNFYGGWSARWRAGTSGAILSDLDYQERVQHGDRDDGDKCERAAGLDGGGAEPPYCGGLMWQLYIVSGTSEA